MRRIAWRITGVAVYALGILGAVSLGTMIVDREHPIEYLRARALNLAVEQGGTIGLEFQVFRTRICPAVTNRWLYDHVNTRHAIPQFTVGLERLAGKETYQRTITIPPAAAVGKAQYQVDTSYYCNPLQRVLGWPINVRSPPIQFLITPSLTDQP